MRDFKTEHNRRKQARKRLVVEIDKDTAAQLDEKLKADKLKFSEWIKERIERYLKG